MGNRKGGEAVTPRLNLSQASALFSGRLSTSSKVAVFVCQEESYLSWVYGVYFINGCFRFMFSDENDGSLLSLELQYCILCVRFSKALPHTRC